MTFEKLRLMSGKRTPNSQQMVWFWGMNDSRTGKLVQIGTASRTPAMALEKLHRWEKQRML